MPICVAAGWLLFACTQSNTPQAGGSQTHWLRGCDASGDCAGLSCICGHCVQPCEPDDSCAVAGRVAKCQQPSTEAAFALCSDSTETTPATPVCLEPCGGGCDKGQMCVADSCVPKPPVVNPPPPPGKDCTYDGKDYSVGDSFPSSDGCNQCSCGAGGDVACTERACAFTWYRTCGAPVCGAPGSDGPTGAPLCTTETAGDGCPTADVTCDPGTGCSVNLICAAADPTMGPGGCPMSRARYKDGIRYLDSGELAQVAAELLATPLARWHYKNDRSQQDQMGFIIDDVEPSPSVEGDHVNLYGYTSMAVAALKVQSGQLKALEGELLLMRQQLLELQDRCGAQTQPGADQRRPEP